MRCISLTEYRKSGPYTLSVTERDALLGLAKHEAGEARLPLTIEPRVGAEDEYDLTPSSTVGAVEVGDLSVLVEPKIGIGQVLSLACYAIDKVKFQPNDFDFPEEPALPDVLALALVRDARKAFSRGLLHGYIEREEALFTVRGRIRFDEQLRRRPGMLLPIEVRYDEFTDDILPNQLVKAAARRLGRMRLRSPEARRGLGWVAGMLDNVSLREWRPADVPEVKFDRLNEHYRGVVALSRLVLRHGEFEARRGEIRASGFLMDMNKVFQEFVTVALREELGLTEKTFDLGRGYRLDRQNQVRLEPDLVWQEGAEPVFVGDAKYKRLRGNDIPNADLYQLLAYTIALGLPGGLLVYAKDDDDPDVRDASYKVRNAGKRLEVAALDLSGSLDVVLKRVGSLAGKVRELRESAQRAAA